MRATAGLTALALLSIAWLGGIAPARAESASPPSGCEVPAYLLSSESELKKVAEAVKTDGRLDILVIGSRSATVVAPNGSGFPGRMEAALRDKLPGVAVKVDLRLQIKKTAAEVSGELGQILGEGQPPTLVIWQTGTVDAMRAVDPDDFRTAVDEGVATLQKRGSDVVLMNLQYGPRMETMITTAPYLDVLRVVAQQHGAPLFDRFAIMHHWNETGQFDLFNNSRGIDLAKRVHDCLGRALASFVIGAARVNPAELRTPRQ
ncbi:MAG: SGNH/GDSL hydrolase family protein [Xanthobacteraceae bacterium]|nr:SGNH/GDSL hydrolase family protein [Xanthobacteraceae bacterium]